MSHGASATIWIIAVNTVVFLTVWISGISAAWTGLPSGLEELAARPWTPLSYMFVHYSLWHLLVNMMWLWMFGSVLGLTMPGRWVWTIYLVGGMTGALFYIVWGLMSHAADTLLCGASASVTAVMTAAGLRSPALSLRLWLIGSVRLKWVVTAGVVLIFIGAGGGGFPAHIGGLSAGILIMMAIRHTPAVRMPQAAKNYLRLRKDIAKGKRLRKALEKRRLDMARLDTLLDKVKISGFDSLATDEKTELQRLSAELSAGRGSFSGIPHSDDRETTPGK